MNTIYFPTIKEFKNCTPATPMPAGQKPVRGVEWFHHMPPHGVVKQADGTVLNKCPWCGTEFVTKSTGKPFDFRDQEARKERLGKLAEMKAKGFERYVFPSGVAK